MASLHLLEVAIMSDFSDLHYRRRESVKNLSSEEQATIKEKSQASQAHYREARREDLACKERERCLR